MKTLMVGLGGTGCVVVSHVKRMVGTKDPTIQFVGFDTDINQEDTEGLAVIQTSREASAGEILRSEPGWQQWFPDNHMLRGRDMREGAGQCRVLSRLAFSDTARRRSSLTELDEAIRALSLEKGQVKSEPLKVVIVSSFAGGTGSGMFLQTPLFLRKYLQKWYQLSNVRIRGIFALPDIFQNGSNDVQEESMYANAYASLRELSAVNAFCLSNNPELNRYQMRIGDLFDSKKMISRHNSANPAITPAAAKPYDFIFFIDNLNRNNRILNTPEEYTDIMARIAYMQSYSPMANKNASREDNLILTQMLGDGESMYGSAGCAKLAYPYEDVAAYCAVRATCDVVSGKWMVIDQKFRARQEEATAMRLNDPSFRLPDRGEMYMEEFNNYIDSNNASFAFLRDSVRQVIVTPQDAGGREETVNRTDEFFKKVDMRVRAVFDGDRAIAGDRAACELNFRDVSMFDHDAAVKLIEDGENSLAQLFSTVKDRTNVLYRNIVNSVIPDRLGAVDDDVSNGWNIRNLLEIEGSRGRFAVHPLAARHLLYSLRKKVSDEQDQLAKSVESLYNQIVSYFATDYNSKTSDVVEKAYEVVPRLIIARYNYKRNYADAFASTKKLLEIYGLNRLQEITYRFLLKRLDALIVFYERMFDSLPDVLQDLQTRSQRLENKYAEDGPLATYLCASPEDLRRVYAKVRVADDSTSQSGIYDSIFATLYDGALEEMRLREEQKTYKVTEDDEGEQKRRMFLSVSSLFDEQVVPYYSRELKRENAAQLDIDVYTALEKTVEARLIAEAEEKRVKPDLSSAKKAEKRKEILSGVAQKAAPFLTNRNYHEPNPDVGADTGFTNEIDSLFWGLNDDVCTRIQRDFGKASAYFLTQNTLASDLTDSRMYSPYEFDCYRALYGVRLSEIPKFREDEDQKGLFYTFYESRVNKMLIGRYNHPDEGVTPHLDYHWHSRQYLPMISPEKNLRDDQDAARALWLGLFYGRIADSYDRKAARHIVMAHFTARDSGGRADEMRYPSRELKVDEKSIRIDQVYEIFRALQQDPLTARRLLEVLEPALEQDSALTGVNYDFAGRRAIPLALAMIDAKGERAASAPADDVPEEEEELISRSNALTLMSRVLGHRQASDKEKKLIMGELWKIIQQFSAEMSDDRADELLYRIFINSPYTRELQRVGADIALTPYFTRTIERYKETKGARGRKKTSKTEA